MPFSLARLFTAVGEMRVSIGPPIRIIERGASGSPASSITDTAASTGTEGWHTAITWVSSPRWCSMAIT